MIGLLMLAAAVTCPGGPIFGFEPRSDRFSAATESALPAYIENMNSELWRQGWITVSPTVVDANDRAALRLVKLRERAIRSRLVRLGVSRQRIRFERLNASYGSEPRTWENVYPSTLSVSDAHFKRMVSPGMMC